ncbi:MAG TPA: type II toxin-antitoxin system VapC family toxin [Chloroflexota bacterium]
MPARIYLDTSIVVAAMIGGVAHSAPSCEFCQRLAVAGSQIYYSQLLPLEVVEAIKNLVVRRPAQLPEHLRRRYRLDDWESDRVVRQRWLAFGIRQFDAFLDQFDRVVELPLHETIWRRSIRLMSQYKLRSYDAVHLATAKEHNLRHFATVDRWFAAVTSPRIWLTRDAPS